MGVGIGAAFRCERALFHAYPRSQPMRTSLPSFVLVAAAASLALACGSSDSKVEKDQVVESSQQRDQHPAVPTEDRDQLAKDNLAFALDMTRSVAATDRNANVFLSPYSISVALAMVSAGARGDTATEMAAALHLSLPQDRLHPAFDAIDLALTDAANSGIKLSVANSTWAEKTSHFEMPFLDTLAKSYGAGVHLSDFIGAPDAARVHINDWTATKTEDRIKDLLPEGSIKSTTRLVLVNAIYFKAKWKTPFAVGNTTPAKFTRRDGSQVDTKLMYNGDSYRYGETADYQAVELPYTSDTAAMIVVLPKPERLDAFESTLDAAAFAAIEQDMKVAHVDVSLPTFEIAGASLSVADHLRGLGMKKAFDSTAADFSGMSQKERLVLDDVIHKAFVKVDESGTEAAAATAAVVGLTAAPADPKTFKADRPFYVFLKDAATHTLLFTGRVGDPSAR
jgi:serpin B